MSKLTKPSVDPIDLDPKTLDQVSGGSFLQGGLYAAMQTGGVQVASSFGGNNTTTETQTTETICHIVSKTYFCKVKG